MKNMRKILVAVLVWLLAATPASQAQTVRNLLLMGGGIPQWVVNRINPPDLALDFANNRAWSKTGGVTPAASLLTVSRASVGYVNDSAGNWTLIGANLPRISNLGLLVEESRTNSVRNNSMQGAVVMANSVELVANGTFTPAGGTGWTQTVIGGSVNFTVAGQVTILGDGTINHNYIEQQITGLTVGRGYTFRGSTTGGTADLSLSTTQGGANVLGNATFAGLIDAAPFLGFTATQSTYWLRIGRTTASNLVVTSASVQDGERVQNGGFTSNPINASQNTVQNGWQWSIGGGTTTVTYASNQVTITPDGANQGRLDTSIPTVAGFTYTLQFDATVAAAAGQLLVGTAQGGSTLLNLATIGTAVAQKFQFTATGATTWIRFQKSPLGTYVLSNVSVQSAGALPTNWTASGAGYVVSVVALSVVNGTDTIDIRFNGTNNSQFPAISIDGLNGIAAAYGQTWTASSFDARIAAVDVANVTSQTVQVTNGPGVFRGTAYSANVTSSLVRDSGSITMTTAADTGIAIKYAITMNAASGATMDQTIRIGWPQLENNPLINSTVASAVKAADGTAGVNGSAVYSVGGGTGTAATLNVTWAAGVMTVNSVASAGNYTVFPPSPAALTYVSGAATGWTGATVTLTPTNLAAQAFATSPIRTTTVAATRNADLVTLTTSPSFGAAFSLYAKGTPQSPNTAAVPQGLINLGDGTAANRASLRRSTVDPYELISVSASVSSNQAVGNWLQNNSGKLFGSFASGAQQLYGNGVAGAGTAGNQLAAINTVTFGVAAPTSQFFNGFVEYNGIWATQGVPAAQGQSMTTP